MLEFMIRLMYVGGFSLAEIPCLGSTTGNNGNYKFHETERKKKRFLCNFYDVNDSSAPQIAVKLQLLTQMFALTFFRFLASSFRIFRRNSLKIQRQRQREENVAVFN